MVEALSLAGMIPFYFFCGILVVVAVVLCVCGIMVCRQRHDESHRGKWK